MHIAAVVGLGNPGEEYSDTRHNVGFAVVDELARRWRLSSWRTRYRAKVVRRPGGSSTILVKPQTFMNLSGDALALFCEGEEVVPGQCLVVVDDVDLPLGTLRLRASGGPGTHNGLRSIAEAVGEGFPRLRLGVRGASPWEDLAEYVLAPFESGERDAARGMVARAADCVEAALRVGVGRAATQFNQAPSPAEP
ncbi:MAG TPA: aminoacyl-tRNA hydrolase [Thermoanaerobaculaceae bacterium]|nr:aminoacyl-tRNA hydrolase [Thermoanaerobaculaceae bacterium]